VPTLVIEPMAHCSCCGNAHNECPCLEIARELVRAIVLVRPLTAERLQQYNRMARRFSKHTWTEFFDEALEELRQQADQQGRNA
jgi:hypothetical protein